MVYLAFQSQPACPKIDFKGPERNVLPGVCDRHAAGLPRMAEIMVAAIDAPKLPPIRLQHPQHVPAAVASHPTPLVKYIYTQDHPSSRRGSKDAAGGTISYPNISACFFSTTESRA